jgi:hypothetical protein
MNNPFVKNDFLCLNASINKLIIEKMPTDRVKQNIQGKAALEIFSTQLFIEEIRKNYKGLKLDIDKIVDKTLPQHLEKCLGSDDDSVKEVANGIIRLFGERLAIILLTLKKGEHANRLKRKDWDDEHWDYWNRIENVVLVGGLASLMLGEKLKYYIEKVFMESNENCYNIKLVQNSADVGIIGCSTYVQTENERDLHLIFDFGHTFIKRSLVKIEDKKVKNIIKLDKILSRHVKLEFEDDEEKQEAVELHNHLLNSIVDTINILAEKASSIGEHIVISIANYVENGVFANRGGYGKLRLLSDNYEIYLANALLQKLNKSFKITLVHDGTAMAAAFSNYSNSVCISLGTAFGVGFPIDKRVNISDVHDHTE